MSCDLRQAKGRKSGNLLVAFWRLAGLLFGRALLPPVRKIEKRAEPTSYGQTDQHVQHRLIVCPEETQYLGSVYMTEIGIEKEADSAAERKRGQEVLARIVQGSRRRLGRLRK